MARFSLAGLERDLLAVVRLLQRHRVRYALIGAVALSVWGRPRTTLDLDFLIQVDEAGLENIQAWAAASGIKADERWLRWNPMLRGAQLRLHRERTAIDLLRPRDAHDRQALRRRKRVKLSRMALWLIAPEDLILQKLKVGRPRDFEDSVTILERLRGKLDRAYLKRWARRLGIDEELRYITDL